MNQETKEEEFAATIGIDWSDKKHDIYILAAGSDKAEYKQIKQTPEAISEWINQLRTRFGGNKIAICLEQSRGALINALTNYDFLVLYPINPKSLKKYREAFASSGAKDDPSDGYLLMELVTKHRDKFKPWVPDNELTRKIALLSEARKKAINLRTQLINRLIALLKGYYPQALELAGKELKSTMSYDFLLRWPTLEEVQSEETQNIRDFYCEHHSRRGNVIKRRLELIEKASALTTDRAIIESSVISVKMLVKQLSTLADSIKEYDTKIQELFGKHPDSDIYSSLPGAGAVYAPRLLTAFGTDRDRFNSAEEMQKYSGIAPVTEQSGNMRWVHMRFACPKFLRQSFHEFANQSIKYSIWSRTYYEQQRAKGKKHHKAIRSLAFKWIRIIFRCWKNRQAYDEVKYLRILQKKGAASLNYTGSVTV